MYPGLGSRLFFASWISDSESKKNGYEKKHIPSCNVVARSFEHRSAVFLKKRAEYRDEIGEEGRKLLLRKNN